MKSSASPDWWAKILTAFMFAVVALLIYQIIMKNEAKAEMGLGFGIIVLGFTITWCYVLSVKQYVIKDNRLIIKRVKGQKSFDLDKLTSVEEYIKVKKGMTWVLWAT